jgi:hypothetical protein
LTNSFAILCSHGTAVSGIIAGLKGNNICTVGVAYNASLVGKIPMNNVAKQTFDLIFGVLTPLSAIFQRLQSIAKLFVKQHYLYEL